MVVGDAAGKAGTGQGYVWCVGSVMLLGCYDMRLHNR